MNLVRIVTVLALAASATGCAGTKKRRLTDQEIVGIARERVRAMFPNDDVDHFETHVRNEVRVIFSPLKDPDDIAVTGGVEVVIDPETGDIIIVHAG